ncbi:MAG: DUF5683 domain-containing protein [Mucilaginibacter sp.]
MYKCLFLSWVAICFAFAAYAQKPDTTSHAKSKNDSLTLKHDSATSKKYVPRVKKEKVYHPDSLHDPHKAVMRSLMIPGWGQLYNHRWWKLPLIYGGLGSLIYGVVWNQQNYSLLLKEDILREHGVTQGRNAEFIGVSDADIDAATNYYRRNRDLCILGTLGFWGIQMIDAYVDAKFIRSYTMDNNLSFKIKPTIIGQPSYAFNSVGSYYPGVSLTFTLK